MSLAGKHSLVVVEHDMSFVEALGGWSRCCTKARCSPRATSPRCRTTNG